MLDLILCDFSEKRGPSHTKRTTRNAKIAGMPKSLHMKGNDYNVAVTVFTVSYIVFGVPANLIVKKLGPKMLAVYMFAWGRPVYRYHDACWLLTTVSKVFVPWDRALRGPLPV